MSGHKIGFDGEAKNSKTFHRFNKNFGARDKQDKNP